MLKPEKNWESKKGFPKTAPESDVAFIKIHVDGRSATTVHDSRFESNLKFFDLFFNA